MFGLRPNPLRRLERSGPSPALPLAKFRDDLGCVARRHLAGIDELNAPFRLFGPQRIEPGIRRVQAREQILDQLGALGKRHEPNLEASGYDAGARRGSYSSVLATRKPM